MEDECYLCGSDKYHTRVSVIDWTNKMKICWGCEEKINKGMEMMTVYKKCRIEIAHRIDGHATCGKVHGHSIDIVVGIRGRLHLKTGMVMDFKTIKHYIKKEVVDRFDHAFLNDTLPIPTAEYLALYIFKKLTFAGLNVVVVRVHETENNYVEYKGPKDV
jgi:6-pyruvoyltetrahydropterin/6-carboxytetrahydropterin synthase